MSIFKSIKPWLLIAIPALAVFLFLWPGQVSDLFGDNFKPHFYYFGGDPWTIRLHVTADAIIAFFYSVSALLLLYFLYKQRSLRFHWVVFAFCLYLMARGVIHFLEISTLWIGAHQLAGIMNVLTAVSSLTMVVAIPTLIPKVLKLPTLEDLERANAELRSEIAERQKVEARLAHQAAVLQTILNSIPSGVIVADENARITAFNPAAESLLGSQVRTTVPTQWPHQYGLFLDDSATPYPADRLPLVRALRGEATANAEMFIRNAQCAEGKTVNCYASPMLDANHNVKGGVVIFHDISEFKQTQSALQRAKAELEQRVAERTAELSHTVELLERENIERWRTGAALEASKRQLQLITDSAPVLIAYCDTDYRYRFVNKPYAERFGLSPKGVVGQRIPDVVGEEAFKSFKNYVDTCLGGKSVEFEMAVPYEEIGTRHMHCAYVPQMNEDGKTQALVAVITDVTGRVQMDEVLRQSEMRFRATFNQAAVGVAHVGLDGRWLLVNQKLCDIVGYTEAELLKKTFQEITHPDDLDADLDFVRRMLAGELQTYMMEKRYIRKDGSLVWINLTVSLARQTNGEPEYFISVVEDISSRKAAEMARQASEQRYRQLADAMPQIVWTANPDGRLDYYNQQWFDYTGLTLEQTQGWRPVLHPDDRQRCIEAWRRAVATGESYEIEYRFKRAADGVYRWHLGRAVPARDAAGRVIKWYGSCTDIDDQKRTEEALQVARQELEQRVEQRTQELCAANALLRDEIREREQVEEELRKQTSILTSILDSMAEAVIVADQNERFLIFNPAAERMFGKSSTDTNSQQWSQEYGLFLPDMVTPFPAEDLPLARAVRGELVNDLLMFVRHEKAPAGVWTLISGRPLCDRQGSVKGGVIVCRDITVRKQIEQELKEAHDRALETARLKSEFLANMSHEIRTPMNGVIGMTDLLLDTELDSQQRRFAETIEESAESLLHIIDDILDFSKIEAGKLEIEQTDFHLRDCLNQAIKTLALRAKTKGLELACQVHPDVCDTLIGDPVRLRQIIINLVGNAIKFTLQGEVSVSAEAQPLNREEILLHIRVSDTGIGIPLDKQGYIFEAFAQSDGSTTRKYGGTGLGLAITSQITRLMGGEIGVESEVGIGSTFQIALPFRLQMNAGTKAAFAPVEPETARRRKILPAGQPLNILLAEDNVVNQTLAVNLLKKRGHSATIVENGAEAVAAVEKRQFDLILMDIQMPGMDGYEATSRIRERERETRAHIPIIAMTANAMRGDRERCLDEGMDAYISKPIQAEEFFRIIESFSHKPVVIEAGPGEAGALADEPDRIRMLDSVGGDKLLLKQVVALFLRTYPKLLAEIDSATAASDRKVLERAAHTLKGSGGMFLSRKASELVRELEQIGREGDLTEARQIAFELKQEMNRIHVSLAALA